MTTLLSGVRYLASQMLYFTSMAEFWVTANYRITILCFTSKSIHHHGEKKKDRDKKREKTNFFLLITPLLLLLIETLAEQFLNQPYLKHITECPWIPPICPEWRAPMTHAAAEGVPWKQVLCSSTPCPAPATLTHNINIGFQNTGTILKADLFSKPTTQMRQ